MSECADPTCKWKPIPHYQHEPDGPIYALMTKPPLLPDDDTAVERLADVLPWFGEWYGNSVEMNGLDPSIGPRDVGEAEHDAAWRRLAAAIIERLREGGQREDAESLHPNAPWNDDS